MRIDDYEVLDDRTADQVAAINEQIREITELIVDFSLHPERYPALAPTDLNPLQRAVEDLEQMRYLLLYQRKRPLKKILDTLLGRV